jgi:hypothetical protein
MPPVMSNVHIRYRVAACSCGTSTRLIRATGQRWKAR